MLIASHAMNAPAAVIGIKKKFTLQVERLREAIDEFETAGVVKRGFLEIALGPDDYCSAKRRPCWR